MQHISTALIALGSNVNIPNVTASINNTGWYVINRAPINTREGILNELINVKPTFLLMSSLLTGAISLEEVLIKAKQISPRTKILLLVTEDDSTRLINYLLANVNAIIHVERFTESIEFAINQLMSKGEVFLCSKTASDFKVLLQEKKVGIKLELGLLELLTDRELEVLYSLTQGINYKQISKLLFISESTVKTHINNIFTKLNVSDRTQAVLYALKHGIENLIKKPEIIKNFQSEIVKNS